MRKVLLTVADARKTAGSWLAEHNRTVRAPDWWDDFSKVDGLFWDATRHEAVIDKGHVEDGKKNKIRGQAVSPHHPIGAQEPGRQDRQG
ncbi:hypothetical protein FHR32_004435 [Streptosporangium album]|uniref:Uncharacterized protein n=1 Tax=Streptosporangium album TaxID=47479 RepID=A0A7W7RXU4_9ACTN|nr:hypothetical protein [Streptosporangium album]MBB4940130.1 hypothetical protein [Streptosporangium album]